MSGIVLRTADGLPPEAHHALGIVRSLLTVAARIESGSAPARSDELVIGVGPAAACPADAALHVPVEDWPVWNPAEVRLSEWDGLPLLVTGPPETARATGAVPAGWLRAIAFLVCREEERAIRKRDQWDCFAAPFSRLHELQVLDRPLVNEWVTRFEQLAREAASRRGITLPTRPRWPNGAPFAVALSHDVDWTRRYSWSDGLREIRRARSPRDYAFRHGVTTLLGAWRHGRADRDPFWTFDRWVDEEQRRGFRSSFFVCPPDPVREHPYDPTYRFEDPVRFRERMTTLGAMFRAIADEGFEVGVHGSYLSFRDADALARQRDTVTRALGRKVTGIRQHFLRFDSAATWAAQERGGFGHDATLGYNEGIGFRAGIAAPFPAWDPEGRRPLRLLEVPTTVMDGVLFRTLGLDVATAAVRTIEHLRRVEACGGLAVLLWHPNATDEQAFPGWWRCYLTVLDDLAARGAWVTSVAGVAEAWRARDAAHDGSSA
jgi:hypothetical protein